MPARIPRRSFATPFVVTLAAACSSSSQPPPQPPVMNPPPPADPTPPADPPPPTDPQTPPTTGIPPMNPPAPVQRGPWHVFKGNDGSCYAGVQVECPKPEPGKPMHTCNPPPAHKYAPCPEGVSETNQVTIVSWGPDNCRLDVPMPSCPPKVHCNPPPPRQVPCPE